MCRVIDEYRKKYKYDFTNYFNLKDIGRDAEEVMNKLHKEYGTTCVIEIVKMMGFKIFLAEFHDMSISGTLGISDELKDKYGSNKVIIINNQDTDKEILFTLAHEIARYIYDYKVNDLGYSNTFRRDKAWSDEEIRANRFAVSFLLPQERFRKVYEKNSNVQYLSDKFNVPKTAVKKRIKELNLNNE